MSTLSHKLTLGVQQKQILTPGLVQMVTILQMTRMELKDMIVQEIEQNPVLEEGQVANDDPLIEELQAQFEAERAHDPADRSILEATREPAAEFDAPEPPSAAEALITAESPAVEAKTTDPFDEIDYGAYFDEYLDPGYKSPASEVSDKPSFETFLSSPVTLSSHLEEQLAVLVLPEKVRDACDTIIGNLDENGYLTMSIEEILENDTSHELQDMEEALHWVQTLDPAGVACRDLRECLLIQLKSRNAEDSVAWIIVHDHLKLLETKQVKEIARIMGRPLEHIQIAAHVIRHLDPTPGLRYSGEGARKIEPDVYITKDGDDYIIELNDDDIPQVRLNPEYRHLLHRDQEPNKDTRNYLKDRYQSALQLIKNIEQRKQTIMKVCQTVVRRQSEFLEKGLDYLRPMMIKDVADEIGVHPSTVSRAVSAKYVHTPQGVFELRYFFGEAVQGPSGASIPLLTLKRMVKKMIDDEDPLKPFTDEQITDKLQAAGIDVTRRTVAKYREDMKIPSTHQRRKRE
jgi:RNA polymerase sigma-54 factor